MLRRRPGSLAHKRECGGVAGIQLLFVEARFVGRDTDRFHVLKSHIANNSVFLFVVKRSCLPRGSASLLYTSPTGD